MDWMDGMQRAIGYIESNLTEEIDFEEAAKCACASPFHFQRMFTVLTGMTLGEYIRNRRLTIAGQELALSGGKVVDVALRYGYESPEAFAKAFSRFHGVTPSAARLPGTALKSFGRLSIQVVLKGEKEMRYRIVEKEAFTVVGLKKKVPKAGGENFKIIPAFWGDVMKNGMWEKLCVMAAGKPMGIMGICANFGKDFFDYLIAVENEGACPSGMEPLQIPKATWAVFEAVGPTPGAIQDVWTRIWSEWFPTSGYECTEAPEIEVYGQGDCTLQDYKSEVWIPVVKK